MTNATYLEYFWVKNETSSSGTVTIKKNNTNAPTVTVEYSTDGVTWTTKGTTSTTTMTFTLSANSKIYFKATADCWGNISSAFRYNYFSSDMNCSIGGNIMSLLWGDSFIEKKTFPNEDIQGIFNGLFYQWTNLVDAGELVLPVTHIESTSGYMGDRCYRSLFQNCSNLVNGPHIDLRRENNEAFNAFQNTFNGCDSLQNVTINTQYGADTNMFVNVDDEFILFNQSGTWWNDALLYGGRVENVYSLYFGYDRVTEWRIPEGEVTKVVDSQNRIIWEKETIDPKYLEPFYVKNNGSTVKTLSWNPSAYTVNPNNTTVTLYYSTDNINYSSVVIQNTTFTIDIQPNTKLYFKSVMNFEKSYSSGSPKWNDEIGGNIGSLFYGLDFTGREQSYPEYYNEDYKEWMIHEHIASYMFSWSNITTAKNLCLLNNAFSAHDHMFYHCQKLITPPELPATTLADSCYEGLFYDCSSLTTAPELPATTLASSCYSKMFYGCSSLIQAPSILPATLPAAYSYNSMFQGCTSMISSPEIMLISFYKDGSAYYFDSCSGMFYDCTSLTSIKIHATEWPSSSYLATNNWVNNVATNGTFYKPTSLPTVFGPSNIPSGWTVVEV